MGNDVEILHMGYLLIERGKLVEMRCEQAEGVDLGSDVSAKGQSLKSTQRTDGSLTRI